MHTLNQQQLVRDHFDSISSQWAALYTGDVSFHKYNFIIRKKHVLDLFDKTRGQFLDAGCGTGDFIPDLLDRGGDVVALDCAAEMIEQAKTRLSSHPSSDRVRFLVGDVSRLDFPDHHFDAAIAVGLIEYLPDVEAALKEMHRVLRRGGILIATVPSLASPFMAYDTAVPAVKNMAKRALALAGLRTPPPMFRHRHFFPWSLDRKLRRVGFRKLDRAFCTYGLWDQRLEALSLNISRKLDRFAHSPIGLLGTNYIVKVAKC